MMLRVAVGRSALLFSAPFLRRTVITVGNQKAASKSIQWLLSTTHVVFLECLLLAPSAPLITAQVSDGLKAAIPLWIVIFEIFV